MTERSRDWYSFTSESGTTPLIDIRSPPVESVPVTCPRLPEMSEVRSPTNRSGAVISILTMGSSMIGEALRIASITALRPAVTNAISFESTSWLLPSYTMTLRSSTG